MQPVVTAAPQYVMWNYTYFCNLNCDHCYSRAAHYPAELDETAYARICEQLIRLRVFKVALGGGEVLFRKDALTTTAALRDGGVRVVITTNGWPITPRAARALGAARLNELYVSIDSHRAEFHDVFRRKEGSLARAVNAVQLASDAGVRTLLSCVLTKANLDDVRPMVEMAERIGAAGINFKRFRPSGNGLKSRAIYELPESAGAALDAQLKEIADRSAIEITLNYAPEVGEIDAGCSCGTRSIALRPNGDVALCSYTEKVLGNLRSTPLADIWRDSPVLKAKRSGVSCAALHAQFSPSNPGLIPRAADDLLSA
jgi:MoaA/NifB/PqqE/SkfB family radical SAM enzyme